MKIRFVLLMLCASFSVSAQQDSVAIKYAATITPSDLRAHLEVLASDEYEGRETGLPGQKKAAEYISNYFASLGIEPCIEGSYFQEFPLKKIKGMNSTAAINGTEWKFMDSFFFFPGFIDTEVKSTKLVFAGYGIENEIYSDYSSLTANDVKGNMVLVMEGEPVNSKGISAITKTEKMSDWAEDWRLKRKTAQKQGARAIVIVKSDYESYVKRVRYFLENPSMRLDYDKQRGEDLIPTFFVNKDMANAMMHSGKCSIDRAQKKINKKSKSLSKVMDCSIDFRIQRDQENFTSENILGFIPGSDSILKNEVVVITAHYDHVGMKDGEVYNGADDDGSGTVTALELAQAFKMAADEGDGPRRSILIMTVSGEEKGLLGSEWYSEYPIFPLENTVCDLNIDMIGRVDKEHADDDRYVYLIGSDKLSTELHSISEKCNSEYTKLALDYTFNSPDDPNRFYYRSDHYNFAKHGIPVIFYFSGVHDDYHQPGDDVEKILFDKTAEIGKLVFYTAWEVANRDNKLVVDVENEFKTVE
ncbi:MAG: hypothetical protein ACJAV7_001140 [Flavobacteriales bacterium]|jgi:hypothetical protein